MGIMGLTIETMEEIIETVEKRGDFRNWCVDAHGMSLATWMNMPDIAKISIVRDWLGYQDWSESEVQHLMDYTTPVLSVEGIKEALKLI